MNKNRILFLVLGSTQRSVLISQVDKALKFLEEHHIPVGVIWFQGPKSFVSRLIAKDVAITNGSVSKTIFVPIIGKPHWLFRQLVKASLWRLLWPNSKENGKIIIQSRFMDLVNIATELREKCPNSIYVIYEIRGVLSVEKEYLAMHQEIKVDKKEINFLKQQEKMAATRADAIICVSERFKRYLIQEYSLDAEKIDVIPSCVDTEAFFYNQAMRNEERARLNLENRYVVIYSGSMFAWQLPEQMVKVFSIIKKIRDDAYFLVLTNEAETILSYIKAEKINTSDYHILNVKHQDVHKHLMVSDVALLLREDHLVNNVASPVKFAEYIRCGLPVILTRGIGDLDSIVEQNKIGLVLDNLHDLPKSTKELESFVNINWSDKEREEISNIGKAIFSRENYIDVYRKLYLL